MLREARNNVHIEGILEEIDLDYGSYKNKTTGADVECIKGLIKVRCHVNDDTVVVPVHIFTNKITKTGELSKAYKSFEQLMNEFTSIAACGSEEGADCVRITSGKIQMNEYYKDENNLVSFPRISTNFVSRVPKAECKPCAEFEVEMMISKKGMELDAEGVETGRYEVVGIIPGYNSSIQVVKFYASNKNVVSVLDQEWQVEDSVKATGRLNFSTIVETVTNESDFGEPISRERTRSTSELLITGGSRQPLEAEFAFPLEDINKAIAVRNQHLSELKNNAGNGSTRKAPDKKSGGLDSLGF